MNAKPKSLQSKNTIMFPYHSLVVSLTMIIAFELTWQRDCEIRSWTCDHILNICSSQFTNRTMNMWILLAKRIRYISTTQKYFAYCPTYQLSILNYEISSDGKKCAESLDEYVFTCDCSRKSKKRWRKRIPIESSGHREQVTRQFAPHREII